ncbi:unnamed protein product [Sphagnum troendelagicum]|uniref:HAT C-terminal dimerisation domain-containing protein n=1 Tax=Sphagnum troendelagicum TaxID=128251 RepID=A0ABP0TFH6_9BRYO
MTFKLTSDEKKQIENDTLSSGLSSWWRGRAVAFAILARAVRCVLAYPATSTMNECNFSDTSNILTHKRNHCTVATVQLGSDRLATTGCAKVDWLATAGDAREIAIGCGIGQVSKGSCPSLPTTPNIGTTC